MFTLWEKLPDHTIVDTEVRQVWNEAIWDRAEHIQNRSKTKQELKVVDATVLLLVVCIRWGELNCEVNFVEFYLLMGIQHIDRDVCLVLVGNKVVCDIRVASERPQARVTYHDFLLRHKVSFQEHKVGVKRI